MTHTAQTERLRLTGITKAYPGCLANDDIALTIAPGEIHAILGENGAGKSTLMKIIYGLVKPDAGTLYWKGEEVKVRSPGHARVLGIGMVFQHFSLFETLSVLENIALALGTPAREMPALAQKIATVSEKYGMALSPERLVHTLSVGERQRVEIVRCLVQNTELLILDEPTSVLTPQEVEVLFKTLRQLADEGCAIMFISHKLHEVKALCDQATILRAGRVSGECTPANETTTSIARLMVGDDTPISSEFEKRLGEQPLLKVAELSSQSAHDFGIDLKDISFEVKQGEIVGLAGVAGNGQEELLSTLSGETPLTKAQGEAISLNNVAMGHLRPNQRRKQGLSFVPEERLGRGAVPELSLEDNALLTGFSSGLASKGWLMSGKIAAFADKVIRSFNVKTPSAHTAAGSLSGGNLQKFIMGREILQGPKLLVAAHPTWGVDIGAATAIHKELIKLRDMGAGILVVSEDLDELFLISDRIGAICEGRVSPLVPTTQTDIEAIGLGMTGEFETLQQQYKEASHA
ncbi:MAG: ABC transporter ATP-binding protein [Pontibacterium sp.]